MTDKQNQRPENREGTPKPDPETLHTTDPQEHMDGPVSSAIQKAGDAFDTTESKEEADEERERNF